MKDCCGVAELKSACKQINFCGQFQSYLSAAFFSFSSPKW